MRLLLAIDGSESANRAVTLLKGIASPSDTSVTVLSVVQPVVDTALGAGSLGPSGFGAPGMVITPEAYDRLAGAANAEADRIVRAAATQLEAGGLGVELEVREGRPASAIVEMASDLRADIVVLGSHGRGALASALLGSVSTEVVEHAPCAVLVARTTSVTRIVLADDGSAGATVARRFLASMTALHGAPVRVVTVQERTPSWYGWLVPEAADDTQALESAVAADRERHAEVGSDAVAELRAAGFTVESEPREGDGAHEILRSAASFGADLVVTGTRGRTGLARLLLGSVARKLVQHAPCSVLVVRAPGAEGAPSASPN
jgi:nucleotide-binding universal stress UspA family protein